MAEKQSCMIEKIDRDRLKVFAMLEKYPIYEYINGNNADILCAGAFDVLYGYIREIAAIGQMLDVRLRFHIASSEWDFKEKLLQRAPLLAQYSNLSEQPIETYAEFYFYRSLKGMKTVCRYAVVAYKGAEAQNKAIAVLCESARDIKEKVCIHYNGAKRDANGIPGNVELNHLDNLNLRESFLVALGERAFRLHYLYSRDGNPACSYSECREKFSRDVYDQTASAAAALHCRYKLYSIGINPRSRKEDVIGAYDGKVFGEDRQTWNDLIWIEHRRWMMYTIFDGYRAPTLDEIRKYAYVGKNYRWRSDELKLHNCLVPSRRTDGLKLQSYAKARWKNEPEKGVFDPMDEMSLAIHRLAGEKMATARVAVNGELRTIRELLNSCGVLCGDGEAAYQRFCEHINDLFEGKNLMSAEAGFSEIEGYMAECALPRANLQNIRIHLEIVFEYYSFHDFKTSDCVMVDDLPYMMYAPFNVALIKLMSEKVIDNIAAPLLIEPQSVTYVMQQKQQPIDEYRKFFGGRGRGTQVESAVIVREGIDAVRKELKKIIDRYGSRPCVIDVTGANALLSGAVMQLAQQSRKLGVICTDAAKQKVINICGFSEASVYRQRQAIATKEAYELFGARFKESLSGDCDAVPELKKIISKAWKFFRSMKRSEYTALCQFFDKYLKQCGISFFKLSGNGVKSEEKSFEENISKDFFDSIGLRSVLETLQSKGAISNLQIILGKSGILKVKCTLPQENQNALSRLFNELKNEQHEVFTFKYTADNTQLLYAGVRVRQTSSFRVKAEKFFSSYGAAYSVQNVVMRWLNKMCEYGLITSPRMDGDEINFRFCGISLKAARAIFSKSGSILEMYAWWAAVSGKICDEVYPEFGFTWDEEGEIENELDLILGKGMEKAVVSCKMKAYDRSYVYEVLYMAKRFSLNSRAAIIYYPNVGEGETIVTSVERKRVREMGVELIIIQDLEEQARRIAAESEQPVDEDELIHSLLTERLQKLIG